MKPLAPSRQNAPFPLCRGEIRMCSFPDFRDSVQRGDRPAIVWSADHICSDPRISVIAVIPLTTFRCRRRPEQMAIRPPEGGLRCPSLALTSMTGPIDRRRIGERWGCLSPETLRRLEQVVLETFGMGSSFH